MGAPGKAIILVAFVALVLGLSGLGHHDSTVQDYTIFLRSRTLVPPPGVSPALLQQIIPFTSDPTARFYVITQFQKIPSPQEMTTLKNLDLQLLEYLPNLAWFASLPASLETLNAVGALPFHRATVEIQPLDKVSPELSQGVGQWARNPDGTIRLNVQFFRGVSLSEGHRIVTSLGGRVSAELPLLHALTIALPEAQLWSLAQEIKVQWIDQVPPPPSKDNDGTRAAIGVNTVQAPPYNLNGEGVIIGEWDGGWADVSIGEHKAHADLAGRVTIGDPDCQEEDCHIDDHATHVAGTAIGDGTLSTTVGGEPYQWRGMAPKAHIVSFEWWSRDLNEAVTEYQKAIQIHKIHLSTNSWRYRSGGVYELGSQFYDRVVQGDLGKPINILGSAGNLGEEGWGWLSVPNSAKNTITVGATDSASSVLCEFSSRGPTDDGRLKPDIVAPGCDRRGGGIRSTIPNLFIDNWGYDDCDGSGDDFCYPYDYMEGTSMATPAAAGALALILQQYRLTKEKEPLPATLKALLLHSARDLGRPGPDYEYGYGQIDVKAAVDLLREAKGSIIEADMQAQDEMDTYLIRVASQTQVLKVTLVWDDAPGALNAARALTNDLDLELVAPDGKVYQPWLLDPTAPAAPAKTGPDHINNVEQIVVENPLPGQEWLLKVKASRLPSIITEGRPNLSQRYSLIVAGGVWWLPARTPPHADGADQHTAQRGSDDECRTGSYARYCS